MGATEEVSSTRSRGTLPNSARTTRARGLRNLTVVSSLSRSGPPSVSALLRATTSAYSTCSQRRSTTGRRLAPPASPRSGRASMASLDAYSLKKALESTTVSMFCSRICFRIGRPRRAASWNRSRMLAGSATPEFSMMIRSNGRPRFLDSVTSCASAWNRSSPAVQQAHPLSSSTVSARSATRLPGGAAPGPAPSTALTPVLRTSLASMLTSATSFTTHPTRPASPPSSTRRSSVVCDRRHRRRRRFGRMGGRGGRGRGVRPSQGSGPVPAAAGRPPQGPGPGDTPRAREGPRAPRGAPPDLTRAHLPGPEEPREDGHRHRRGRLRRGGHPAPRRGPPAAAARQPPVADGGTNAQPPGQRTVTTACGV